MKSWTISSEDKDLVAKLSNDLSVSNTVAELLVKRGVKDYDTAKDFFRQKLTQKIKQF